MRFVERVVPVSGGDIACLEWTEGEGPTLVFCHATGFCKEVWIPVIEELSQRVRGWTALALDQRFHGRSQGFPADYDWWRLGEDVRDVAADRRSTIGIGHSGGGAAIAMAEVLRPASFAAAILVEPIIFPPSYRAAGYQAHAEAAGRRRRHFASSEAAFANYHGRGPFSGWDDRALRSYVAGGFRPEGDAVTLRCAPESEAQFFLHAAGHAMWDRLGELDLAVSLIAGAGSDTHPAGFLSRQAERIKGATTEIVPEATHFVPMEVPGLLADRIAAVIDTVRGDSS
jgi:pimeloyl-ACP methyl ester carboxylesterase